MTPSITFAATVLDAPHASDLGRFYQRLLGWEVETDSPEWFTLRPPGGGTGLSFQTEPAYEAPVWPGRPGAPLMQLHLDLLVEDLAEASRHAEGCGAVAADHHPQEHVRVYRDPVGHPFCLHTE